MTSIRFGAPLAAILVAACTAAPIPPSGAGHLSAADADKPAHRDIPAPVLVSPALPRPRPVREAETYSVVVNNVRVAELLFALARDAKLNVDIHPGIDGVVTMNAVEQTLPQLLGRIAKEADIRWELDGPNLTVMPDAPFLRTYRVDYVNLSREVASTIAANNRVASAAASAAGSNAGNQSTTKIDNTVRSRFWETLERNVKDILRETDKILPEGSSETVVEKLDEQSAAATTTAAVRAGNGRSATTTQPGATELASRQAGATITRHSTFREAASVIVNPETGVVTVRATSRQHDKVQEYLTAVATSARRQVLIEATIVEVALNDGYSQGIDWSRLRTDGSGFQISGAAAGVSAVSPLTPFSLKFTGDQALQTGLTLKLLETFGTVKVLSSPKLSVLNNQTAILRVVEDYVYFKVDASQNSSVNTGVQTSINTTPQTVSVGLTLAVTPQISDSDAVILDVRPTITQIAALITDPNPQLTAAAPNKVPQLRTREMESVMRVNSGDVAVLGGLMEDGIDYNTNRVPLLGAIPLIGEVFTNRANSARKTELVVFIRPLVLKDASLNGELSAYRAFLPTREFFAAEARRHTPGIIPGRESSP